jgi:HSP20 family protein
LSWFQVPSSVRVEEYVEGEKYMLRVEVPGVDPTKDLTVTYHDGALRLQIRRTDVRKDKTHSEFHYGTFGRTIGLPDGVDEKSIHAAYHDGILEVSAKLMAHEEAYRTIPVSFDKFDKPAMIDKPAVADKPKETVKH